MNTAARKQEFSPESVLYMAIELSANKWKLGFTIGLGQKLRERTLEARDLKGLEEAIARAKSRFKLAEDTPVLCCFEAGRDGFWIDRYLKKIGVTNLVVDPGSIEGNRRWRKRKTDRLDLCTLLRCLVKWHWGDKKVWSVVNVPSEAAEDARHLHRELEALKKERTRHIARIKGLLFGQGIQLLKVGDAFPRYLEVVRRWDGSPLDPMLMARLKREYERFSVVGQQIKDLEVLRRKAIRESPNPVIQQIRHLMQLRGIGENGAWLIVMELFAWREFQNRRQVGSIAGFTPTPWISGGIGREQGIDKAGNRRVRAMMIELAWGWLRYQPDSALSIWFAQRFAGGGKRTRRIGIVAVARRLLIALWRFLIDGVVPQGAVVATPSR